jgi:hypothetical protein
MSTGTEFHERRPATKAFGLLTLDAAEKVYPCKSNHFFSKDQNAKNRYDLLYEHVTAFFAYKTILVPRHCEYQLPKFIYDKN